MTDQLSLFGSPAPPAPQPHPKGSLIYEPKGRAREYAALACNIYKGCDHRCIYCYAPSATHKSASDFAASSTRNDFLAKLEKEARKFSGVTGRILLCFTCDPYQHLDVRSGHTREAIRILKRHGFDVEVLTKGGRRALRDLDLFTAADAFATTLTLLDDDTSLEWEPNAAPPSDRIATIQEFHAAGIPTWVSLEPVLDPEVALEIIHQTCGFVDLYKVGKLNYHRRANEINWQRFVHDAIRALDDLGYVRNTDHDTLQAGQFFIKHDLAAYL